MGAFICREQKGAFGSAPTFCRRTREGRAILGRVARSGQPKDGAEKRKGWQKLFEEMDTTELIEFCMDKFCCIEVCNALGCEEMCKEQDCPLYVLFDRIIKKEREEQ